MKNPALDIRELSRGFGSRQALDKVSFEVEEGSSFGLLGPNGGGKSTLFRIVATLLAPSSGEAFVFGSEVSRDPGAVRAGLGVVFQNPSLDKKLTVLENLLHHGRLYGLTGGELQTRAAEALASYGLSDRAKDRVETLSGGLARRVEIAKALMPRPRLLLLDEPSSNLDPGARAEMWLQLEKARREEGLTLVLTTHLLEEAEGCACLGLLDQGRLAALGSPQALKAEIPGLLLSLSSRDPDRLEAHLRKDMNLEPQRHRAGLRLEHKDPQGLAKTLSERYPALIESFTVGKPSLEDVFMRKTGHGISQE